MITSVQAKAIEATKKFFEIAYKTYGVKFDYTIKFDLRGTTAGTASYNRQYGTSELTNIVINYNNVLLTENEEDFLARTVPHEVAHVVAQRVFGLGFKRINHGPEWKHVMQVFGCDASRCHKYDVTNARVRTTKKFTVECGCRTHMVTQRVITRINAGATFTCRSCKGSIKITSTAPVVAPKKVNVVKPSPVKVVVKSETSPAVTTKKVKVVTGEKTNNLELAKQIYVEYFGSPRKVILEKMVAAGIKAGTAGAYYNKFANHNGM